MTDRHLTDPLALTGWWAFSRVIDDRRADTRSMVTGRANLVAEDSDTVRWHESGTLVIGVRELPVYRTLKVVRRGGKWIVTFDDGRYFHPWTPGEQVQHPCGADLYTGRIDVEATTETAVPRIARWTVQWTVAGPSKDYAMTTVLTL